MNDFFKNSHLFKIRIVLIILSTMIISVGAGHGVAPLFIIQFWLLKALAGFFELHEMWFLPFILFSAGQLSLFICLFKKLDNLIIGFYYGGIGIIICGIISFMYIGLEDGAGFIITIISMVPFLALVRIFRMTNK